MGVGIYPVFDPPVDGTAFNSDGKLLLSELYALDHMCAELGVTNLSAFTDTREPPADFGLDGQDDPDALDELLGEWNEWFDPASALPTIQSLRAALSATAPG